MLNIDTYIEVSDDSENECRHIEAEERTRNKQKHFRNFSLRHSVSWRCMSSLVRSIGFYSQCSSDMIELIDVACYQCIEDHYHGQGHGECHDSVKGVIGDCPGFPVLVQATEGRVSSDDFGEQEHRAAQ